MNPPEWHPWMDDAACAELPPDLWFADSAHWADTRKAVEVCGGCPVRGICLEFGLEERFGVYGGKTVAQRAQLRRSRDAA